MTGGKRAKIEKESNQGSLGTAETDGYIEKEKGLNNCKGA